MSSSNSSRRASKSMSTSRLSGTSTSSSSRKISGRSLSTKKSQVDPNCRSYPYGWGISQSVSSGRPSSASSDWYSDTVDCPFLGDYPLSRARSTGFLPQIGYVPRKGPENVIGATFRRANELALYRDSRRPAYVTDDHFLPLCLSSSSTMQWRRNPGGLGGRLGADVPGYGGYIPGKYSDNVFGQVFAQANRKARTIKLQQAMERNEAQQRLMNG